MLCLLEVSFVPVQPGNAQAQVHISLFTLKPLTLAHFCKENLFFLPSYCLNHISDYLTLAS